MKHLIRRAIIAVRKDEVYWGLVTGSVVVLLIFLCMFFPMFRIQHTGPYDFPNSTWVCEEAGITLYVDETRTVRGTINVEGVIHYFDVGYDSSIRYIRFADISKDVYEDRIKRERLYPNEILFEGLFKATKRKMTAGVVCTELGAEIFGCEPEAGLNLVFIRTA